MASNLHFGRQLTCRYLLALGLVALLSVASWALVQRLLDQQEADGRVINLAGRQRMLSQQLATAASQIGYGPPADQAARKEDLTSTLATWARVHRGLQEGDAALGLAGNNSPELRALFAQLQPHYLALAQAAAQLLDHAAPGPGAPALAAAVLRAAPAYLEQMECIVGQYELEARMRVHRHRQAQGYLLLLTGLLLALSALLIFRPMVAQVAHAQLQQQQAVAQLRQEVAQHQVVAQELQASEERTRLIIDNALDAIVTIDPAGKVTGWNPQAQAIFGWSCREVLGRELCDLVIPPQYRQAHLRAMDRFLATGRPTILNHRIEISALHRDGREFPVELTVSSLRAGGQLSFSAFIRDITQQRQLEEQLRQSQKMEAIGRLAGGVAHDFNNVLTVMTGMSELSLHTVGEDHPIGNHLKMVVQSGERAAGLTRQLLAFSRRQLLQVKVVDLNQTMLGLAKMLRRLIGEDIELVMLPAAEPAWVQTDPGQFEQVILNLAVNARDAMPRGGKLSLELSRTTLDPAAAGPGLEPGPYVLLRCRDTGIGMDAETRKHLFEPFFTTKEPGRGTGLGLATVYGIVQQSRGGIEVTSQPGCGACFEIYLPQVEEGSLTEEPHLQPRAEPAGGGETLLVVEDDEAVRGFCCKILALHGYQVLEAANGVEGFEVYQHSPNPVALVLTDLVMPQQGGRELAEKVRALKGGQRICFMSGYAGTMVSADGAPGEADPLLQKPFTPAELLRTVRSCLDRPSV